MIILAAACIFITLQGDPQRSLELRAGLTSTHNERMSAEAAGQVTQSEKHGKWTILKSLPNGKCIASCECGTTKETYSANIKTGKSKSCGCWSRERAPYKNLKHGLARKGKVVPECNIWNAMLTRCYNANSTSFARYGGIGRGVCDRWRFGESGKTGFQCFYEDMGPRPDGFSIDRIDNDKGYSPENCRWATRNQQARNTKKNKLYTFNGVSLCLADWADKFAGKFTYRCLSNRIFTYKWSIERSFTQPMAIKKRA